VHHPYIALDTETTGLEPGQDELIEVAAIRFQGTETLETWHSLIKPAGELPEEITRLTGITPDDLVRAPFFFDILPELARFIGDDPIVGHSVGFDLDFLAAQALPLGNRRVDTYELSTLLLPELPDRSLISVARGLAIPYPGQHRALADAQATMQVFLAFWQQLVNLDLALLQEIVRLASLVNWPLGQLFEEILAEAVREGFGRQRPSGQPLAMRLVKPEPRPNPLEETESTRPLNSDLLAGLLAPGGLFDQAFPQYEHRPQQIDMLRSIVETLNHSGQLIVEAGTGTGKSIAYLIPAAALALRRGEPVVISTNTINLQDQLFNKDIPDLQHVLAQASPEEYDLYAMSHFNAALLKGRNNYLCLRRWEMLRRNPNLKPEEVRTLVKTLLWLPRTGTGDRAELALVGREYAIWHDLSSAPGACQGSDCPYQQHDQCFFFRARRRAEAAHVIIVNHSLLLADVATDNRVLPAYRQLIVDEAHHLEGVTTDQLGFAVTAEELQAHLAAISWPLGPGREGGLLSILPAFFQGKDVPSAARQTLETLRREVRSSVDAARVSGKAFFDTLQKFIQYQEPQGSSSQYDRHLRITSGTRFQPDWTDVEIAWENVSAELLRIYERLGRLYQLCSQRTEDPSSEEQDLLFEIATLGQRTAEIQQQVTSVVSESRPNDICWVSVAAQNGSLGLHVAPLHVGELLQNGLYQQKEALILTSATLSIEQSTAFLRERLGLPEAEELLLDSPFDYAQAALMLIPEDMPPPNDSQYGRAMARILIQSCLSSEGRTLALFTSHYALRQTYKAIRRPLEREKIAVLGQGLDGSRHVLLEKFRRNPRSILLGTSSFWEGIDVVGEGLSVLIIAKLPFSVPSDPIFASRCELFDDPFYQYAVPQSVLRFKQGFGRLIRSKTDRGVVLMLDPRILVRSYGPVFLESLPPCTIRRVRLLAVPRMVRDWLRRETVG
jgi:DNA polymerase-3 subunit epsilon/ATP-dependent DNA helicase DinG